MRGALAAMSAIMPVVAPSARDSAGGGVEHRLLVLLHVLCVGERQALHHHQQRHQRADDAPGIWRG